MILNIVLPPLVFLITNTLFSFDLAMLSSLGVGALLAFIRSWRRQPVWNALAAAVVLACPDTPGLSGSDLFLADLLRREIGHIILFLSGGWTADPGLGQHCTGLAGSGAGAGVGCQLSVRCLATAAFAGPQRGF